MAYKLPLLLLTLMLVAGCGQKGDLFLPEPSEAAALVSPNELTQQG